MLHNLPTVREQPSRDARAHLTETTLHHQAAARALATGTLRGHHVGLVLHTRGSHRASDTREVPGREQ